MALAREIEQSLERYGLIKHYDKHAQAWQTTAQDAYDFTKKTFSGQQVRPDDVAKALRGAVEVDTALRQELDAKKLRQKYWVDRFTALVVDRTWDKLSK